MFEKKITLCEADMRCNWTNAKKAAYILYYIFAAIMFYSLGPANDYDNNYSAARYLWKIAYYREGISRLTNSRRVEDFYSNLTDNDPSKFYLGKFIICVIITVIVIAIPIVFFATLRDIITQSSLELNSKGLNGSKRTINSRYRVDIPIESINNIGCKKTFISKFIYESTMYINSSKGNFVFHGISNPDKLIKAVLKEIENNKNRQSAPAFDNDAIIKIRSLKQMLDNQLITQEEYEQKKKTILSKM